MDNAHHANSTSGMPAVGQVLHVISGTRPISVTVAAIDAQDVRLRCNTDWSFQGGSEFTIKRDRFPHTIWGRAKVAA